MMKKIIVSLVCLILGFNVVVAQTMYQPNQAELQFIKRVENTLRNRYKGKEIKGVVSDQIVGFMSKIDDMLAEDDLSPRVDWVLGTTKWYLLRIIEQTFPWEVTEPTQESSSSQKSTSTKSNDDDQDDNQTDTTTHLDRGVEFDGEYTLIDVDARKWTFMPAVVTLQQDDKVKLLIHDVDLEHEIFFPELQAWKDTNGKYIIDTTTPGTYQYLCAPSCGEEYQKMIGTIVIE